MTNLVPSEKIDRAILLIRGQKVMLDSDLADLYGVKTSRLNEQVKRNIDRFPPDFMFQLSDKEKEEVVANCDHLSKIRFSPTNPYAFTEHGAIMLASVLSTSTAIHISILIVRAFVRLREILAANKYLARKLEELDSKYDKQFKIVFQVLKELMQKESLTEERPRIGFKINPDQDSISK
jgi:phage regulator Rha-like protein